MLRIPTTVKCLLLLFATSLHAQDDIALHSSNNQELIKALNNAELLAENREQWLGVRIYRLDNGMGSAGYPSSEVSYNLLVAASELDDAPEQRVFQVGPFLNPTFSCWNYVTPYRKEFTLIHGIVSKRDSIGFEIDIEGLAINQVPKIAYGWEELEVLVNGYSVKRPYDKQFFEDTVGRNYTKFVDTNDTIYLEFEHNKYEYYYGTSSIIIDDEYGISDIQIKDASLDINGIKVGDSIEKVKRTFTKYQVRENRLTVWHAANALSFYYDENGLITRIFYFVPT